MIKNTMMMVLMLINVSAYAADDICTAFASLANNAMQAHQDGVALSKVLEVVPDGIAGEESMRIIITNAYKHPRYNTEVNQRRAVAEYRDKVHIQCLEAIR